MCALKLVNFLKKYEPHMVHILATISIWFNLLIGSSKILAASKLDFLSKLPHRSNLVSIVRI